MRASNGAWLPASPSTVRAPAATDASSRLLGLEKPFERQRQAQLRAVEQCEPFLRLEHERLDARCRQDARAIERVGAMRRLAFADQRQGHVRQRREIARRANRPLRGHDRQHIFVQQREQHVGDQWPRT